MLPKSRVVSALLVGLGVALMVAGLLAPRLLPADARLPLDTGSLTWTIRDDSARTRLMSDPNGRVLDSPVSRQYHMTLEEPADSGTVSVRVGSTLARDSRQSDADRLITAGVFNWRMDRLSGEPQGPAQLSDQLASPATDVDMGGVWLKFPADAEQTTYQVFDPVLRGAAPAEFVESVDLNGREVYRYRQVIEPTNLRTRYAGVFNETELPVAEPPADQQPADAEPPAEGQPADAAAGDGAGEAPAEVPADAAPGDEPGEAAAAPQPATEKGYLFHSAERDFYVDQASGLVVKIDEHVDDFYGTFDGRKVQEVLDFNGTMDEGQVTALVDAASEVDPARVTVPVAWGIGAIGALLALVGLAGAFGAFGRRGGRVTPAEGRGARVTPGEGRADR